MFTVRLLTRSFLENLSVRVKLGEIEAVTRDWYTIQLGKLDAAAGDFPAAELKAHHLVSVELTYHFVRTIRALYRWACDEDVALLSRNPFRKLRPPPCGERERILTRSEMLQLYRAAGRDLRRLLFVLSRTIARPGEIRRLCWGDVQWERRLIVLKKFKGKKKRTDGVKVRTIPLDLPTVRMLRNIHRRRGQPGPAAPVWLNRKGRPWSASAVQGQMRRARRRSGLDPDGVERVVCYTMRHTAATEATRAGVTDARLAKVMGHARPDTTRRYQHLAGGDVVEAIDQVVTYRKQRRHSGAK